MYERLASSVLHMAAAQFPVVAILGARQVGKTTLARAAFPDFEYLDLEDPRTAERFRDDARFALERKGDGGLILDDMGIWRGTGNLEGAEVAVTIDYKGNVVTSPKP